MIKKRRTLLGLLASGLTYLISSPAFTGNFLTPSQMVGPFYPDQIPLDHDNDLTRVGGHYGIANGEVSHLIGRVLNSLGQPIVDAKIEIWQCDAYGQYNHPRDGGGQDPAFQGFGRTRSGSNGEYRFKTIKPVPYPGRPPHIHMRIVSGTSKFDVISFVPLLVMFAVNLNCCAEDKPPTEGIAPSLINTPSIVTPAADVDSNMLSNLSFLSG